MDTRFDAIVIGAGPAGSAAAILLAGAGWRVALVEKQAYPRRKVCGECISASNLPILDALGVGDAVARLAGPPLRHVAMVCGARMVRAPLPPCDDPIHQWGLALGREKLDTLLLEQARQRGVALFQPWHVCGIAGTSGSFNCRLRSAGQGEDHLLCAPLVIDAHGAWEPPVAQDGAPQATQVARHRPSDLFAFKQNLAYAALEPGLLPLFSFPGGYGGMVIGGGASATFAFCLRRDALARARARFPDMPPAEAAYRWVRRHASATTVLIGDGVRIGKWLGAGPIRPGIHLGGQCDGVFRIGNAAGEAHPLIGEGISMALQSALVLVDTLVCHGARRADAQAQAHAAYAAAWQGHFARRIRLSSLYAQLAMRPRLFRELMPTLERHPELLTWFARWCGKVHPAPVIAGSKRADVLTTTKGNVREYL